MGALGRLEILGALALATAVVVACGDDGVDPPDPPLPTADSGVDGPGPGPDAAPAWGMPSRPSNPTCLAPARDASNAKVKLEWVFQTIRPQQPTEVIAAPKEFPTLALYVLEQRGRVLGIPGGAPTELVALDIQSVVAFNGEAGLLGLAFHPSFATKRFVYVYYTINHPTPAPDRLFQEIVARYAVMNDGTFDAASETILLRQDQPSELHNGGKLAFGPDGFLYLSIGDGTDSNAAQDLTSLRGKILRIDIDGASPYAVPPSNPLVGAGGGMRPELYAWGFRNPWRFSFDSASGDLWVGDVGQGAWEEMNRVEKGGNYGWPIREGAHCFFGLPCDPAGYIDPFVEHPNSETIAMIGGVVYHGTAIPSLSGRLVYGTYGGPIYALGSDPVTGAPKPELLNGDDPSYHPSALGTGRDGEIYMAEVAQNAIFMIKPAAAATPSPLPDRLSKTGCVDPADPKKLAAGMVPYTVAAELWSDGAEKSRAFAIPDGAKVTVKDDGHLDLPPKSVTMKTFSRGGKRVETRLFVRHDDGGWSGFTYAWNDAQTDADLVVGNRMTSGHYFPSRAECLRCHNENAGRSLGLELAQLEIDFTYPNGARGNQVDNLLHAELLDKTPAARAKSTLANSARGYLHANCSFCHRPGAATAAFDLRATANLSDVCNVAPKAGDLGVAGAKLIVPGDPSKSLVSLRMHRTGAGRMPPLASFVVDPQADSLVDPWIRTAACR